MALTVIKIGGSLSSKASKLQLLMTKLSALSKSKQLVVVPGGGEFADTVRRLDRKFSLDSQISHKMAILGMDQYGLLLSNLAYGSIAVYSFEDAMTAVNSGKLPIFLPSQVMFQEDPLENSWKVTSDSIALYIAYRLNADKVLFVTDVDGVYTADPKTKQPARLIKQISSEELASKKTRTSVDSALPQLLKKWPIACIVVNGFYIERIELLLEDKEAISTHINGKRP